MNYELLGGKIGLEGITNYPIFILLSELFLHFTDDSDVAVGGAIEPAIELHEMEVGDGWGVHDGVAQAVENKHIFF